MKLIKYIGKKRKFARILLVFLFTLMTMVICAQPIVNKDRTVTFRLFSPKADSVKIEGDLVMELTRNFDLSYNHAIPLVKGSDGIWSVTIGPFEPGPYMYNFQIDGKSTPDPNNFRIFSGQKYRKSILLLNTSDSSGIWETRNVNHGTIHHHTYYSSTAKSLSDLFIYTPPGYETSNVKYPVLYLLHGRGEKADSWLNAGFVNNIMDNLLAENRAKPMIIVMPFGWVIPPNTPDSQIISLVMPNFEKEMFVSIIPLTERSYRVSPDAGHRAVAGFSMGGAQTAYIGLNHTDMFSGIGIFSAGIPNFKNDHKALITNPVETNIRLKYFFLGAGTQDKVGPGGSSIDGQRSIDSLLTAKEIRHTFYEMPEAGHTWYAWRYYLGEKFLPGLWK